MTAIIDHQLDLEALSDRIDQSVDLFGEPRATKCAVDRLEHHLGRLIAEFEDVRPAFSGEPPGYALEQMPRLRAFLGERRSFRSFAKPFHRLQELLLADLRRTYEED